MKKLFFLLLIVFVTACSSKTVASTTKARHKSTMRSYHVLGKTYYPKFVQVGDTMSGISSWYGPKFNGKQTSNGEIYDMYASTAAHKTWPMDTRVHITNLQNGKSTIVRINDRGPFVKGRIIDCSYKAGKILGLDKLGIAKVKLKVISVGNRENKVIFAKNKKKYSTKKGNFTLQIGSFSFYEGAKRFERKNSKKYSTRTVTKEFLDVTGKSLYRVFLIGFYSEKEAYLFKEKNSLHYAIVKKG